MWSLVGLAEGLSSEIRKETKCTKCVKYPKEDGCRQCKYMPEGTVQKI